MPPTKLRYKINVLNALRDAGYTSGRIRKEHLLGEQMVQKIRKGEMPSWKAVETICEILHCQPGDLVEYVPDQEEEQKQAPDAGNI